MASDASALIPFTSIFARVMSNMFGWFLSTWLKTVKVNDSLPRSEDSVLWKVMPDTSSEAWFTASENVTERTPVFMSREYSLRNGG